MTTDRPPIFATPGAPNDEPNKDGLTVDLSLLWTRNATPWKVRYTPETEKVSDWVARHPDVSEIVDNSDALKAYYYVDEAVDMFLNFGLPYFELIKAKYETTHSSSDVPT
ncbi:hypothetical protein [Singulisphaera sp. GP187]|uniref:hypothetical protein n=1 Tax=Singulisphaera sp. GP187 TaxID=1882752 RepID=UPI0011610976|nr:hypothetical protein [Singulisphaera sp. GP187]